MPRRCWSKSGSREHLVELNYALIPAFPHLGCLPLQPVYTLFPHALQPQLPHLKLRDSLYCTLPQ